MAFSDLCHISNAYKSVENEPDQSDRIMEENSMVRDLITKILDETGPSEGGSSLQPPEKTLSSIPNQYPKNDAGFAPPPFNYQNNTFNFQDQNGFNYLQNGFGNGFVNYNDSDVGLLGVDPVDPTPDVSPEQLNLLRLAAQEIGGAQFASPNKYDEKFYNFFDPSQRNSLPDTNMFPANNFNRPNSLNLEMNYNNFENFNAQSFPNNNKFENAFMKDQSQDQTEVLAYLNQLNISLERREDVPMEFKMHEMNGHYPNEDFNKLQEQKMFFNRTFQPPPKGFNGENFYLNDMMPMNERPMNQNFDFANQTSVSAANPMNFKPNGFHQNEFMRRDMNQMRDGFPNGAPINEGRNFENAGRENMQQAAVMRQNQEIARQMSLLMRNRPPPNQLNVDVSFLHENTPFNLGLGALLGPSPPAPPPVLPSPMLDMPLLAPFYAMRNIRGAATSSGILHARLDACYEQWRQLERERKRTEARLALAYPGRAVSSSNSIPVPRLPPCPTRVDRLTVDMLREHTKVLTLMGKMETLRASVCVAQNKKPNKPEDGKITVLKRGQENVAGDKKDGVDPATFDPTGWRDDVKNLAEIAPHSEVETAMLSWRSAVAGVQAARRRETQPHQHGSSARYLRQDPILQLADAVKQLCNMARRARCAMWCDLTLTVALAPPHHLETSGEASPTTNKGTNESAHSPNASQLNKPANDTVSSRGNSKQTHNEAKEDKPAKEPPKSDNKQETNNNKTSTNNKQAEKQQEKNQQRRAQNYRKVNQGRNDFYQKNQRYDNNRFMQNRHPYYLATGPIN